MANINGNIYLKPCEGFKKGPLTKRIECGTHLPRSGPNLEGGGCDIVSKPYGYILGHVIILDQDGAQSVRTHVIMCGGPLGGAPSIGVLCSVYKARCCRSSGLGKKEMSLRHKRTKATQQDLDNHILLCRTNGMGYVPHS